MTQNVYKIPLQNVSQKFDITLAGRQYTIACRWNNSRQAGWFLDIDDGVTNEPIVYNMPLVTGTDLLAQYEYLGFKGSLLVFTDGNAGAVPTLEDLGSNSNLYFITND